MPAQPEFLDELIEVQEWSPRRRDVWGQWDQGRFADESFLLSVTLLQALTNEQYTAQISKDTERLDGIEQSLRQRGIDQPLILVVDKAGRLGLKDGHHRTLVAARLGWSALPVRLLQSERLRSHGIPIHDVLLDLLQAGHRDHGRP